MQQNLIRKEEVIMKEEKTTKQNASTKNYYYGSFFNIHLNASGGGVPLLLALIAVALVALVF